MAIDTGMYGLSQFKLAINPETTIGTALKTSMQLVNIDAPPSVDKNTERFLGMRSGDGRTAKVADIYVSENGKEKTVSFTALYDTTVAPIFLSNCMGVAVGTSPASYDIAYNYTPPEVKHADTGMSNYWGSLTLALISPEGSNTAYLPGCMVRNFRMYADAEDDGGRFKMDITLTSRYNFEVGQAAPTTPSVYGATYRTIYELATLTQIDARDMVVNRCEIAINSNVQYHGFGVSGIPHTLIRGLPEMEVTGVFGVKYDANTAEYFHATHSQSNMVVEMSNNATWASATFGWKGSYANIADDFELGEVKNGTFVDIPFKFMGHTSGDLIQVVP